MIARFRQFFHALDRRLGIGYALWRLRYERAEFTSLFVDVRKRPDIRVSVVVPSYGISVADLSELVASLDGQTHGNWELCVCDDADRLPAATAYWKALAQARPGQIKLTVHSENRGISEATRSAMQLASGDIIAFVDGDDRLHPRALDALTRRFGEGDDIDVVYTDHDLMTDFGQRFRPTRKPGFSPELMLSCNYMNHLVAVRSSLAQACAGAFVKQNDGAQDWAFCLAVIRSARRISHVPLVLYHWRARPESIASGGDSKPWAVVAADRVRREHWQQVHPDICFGGPDATGFARPRLGKLPQLVVFSSDPTWAQKLNSGVMLHALSLESVHAAIAAAPERALVLFAGDSAAWTGDFAEMAAFATIKNVACVWPFSSVALRRAYRLGDHRKGGRALVPIEYLQSDFSYLSGNVLCGPTIGLMISRERWLAMVASGFVLPSHVDEIGPAAGLWALAHGHRNVSCSGVVCTDAFAPTRIAAMPDVDPYV